MERWYGARGRPGDFDAWLGVAEVAAYAAVTVDLVIQSIARHELPAVRRHGVSLGAWIVHRHDVEAWSTRRELAAS
jgi:hypothetical protein